MSRVRPDGREIIQVWAEPAMVAAVRARATAGDRSVSAEIRRALRAHLAAHNDDEAAGGDLEVKTGRGGDHHAVYSH
jgi:plasmid stability protein